MKLASPGPKKRARLEIIPLIDVMFFLLAAFMMVSLGMDKMQNTPVNLPSASQARRDYQPGSLNIAVDKAGTVWVQKRALTLAELSLAVSNHFRANPTLPVFISGDRETLHGTMADVYAVVRGAGVQKVAFATAADESRGTR